jgi:hypothetical protein
MRFSHKSLYLVIPTFSLPQGEKAGCFGVFRLMNDPFFDPMLFERIREGARNKSFLNYYDLIVMRNWYSAILLITGFYHF